MDQNRELDGDLLAWAAARAGEWPHLFASIISQYLEIEGIGEEDLCYRLGCDLDTLNRLRLCGRPDHDPSAFTLDVQRVADKFHIDAGVLAAIVREVDAIGVHAQGAVIGARGQRNERLVPVVVDDRPSRHFRRTGRRGLAAARRLHGAGRHAEPRSTRA